MIRTTRSHRQIGMALVAGSMLLLAACSSEDDPQPTGASYAAQSVTSPGETNPMIASGVTIGSDAYFYKSSGLGPEGMNEDAAPGSPETYIDTSVFYGGELSEGVTITEAQGLNALAQIKANLEDQGLTLSDVVSMRVFLDNAPGAPAADFAGWNRAYRQYFANTNLETGDTEMVPMGTAEPNSPLERNPARPTRYAIEVASLPVPGWLVEIEVDAVYPTDKQPQE